MEAAQTPPPSADQLLRIQGVAALTTLSKSCINLWVAQKRFPKPIALSSTVKVWRATDIHDWIEFRFDQMEYGQSPPNLREKRAGTNQPLIPTLTRLRGLK